MQIIASDKFCFIKSVKSILKVSRHDATFSVIQHTEFASEQSSLHAIGEIDAVLGKLRIEDRNFLLVVAGSTQVANRVRKQSEIRRIDRVVAIFVDPNERIDSNQFQETNHLTKLKNSQKTLIKFVSRKTGFVQPRLVSDVLRLFNDNGDFYFETNNEDLTRNLQNASTSKESSPDERFFWNKQMLADLINVQDSAEWIVPVIQGFVAQKNMIIDSEDISSTSLTITLISRRSTKRAGTRYLRRGIDETGDVANFVETELIIDVFGHQLAFVQIRGSVP
uniref:SAC domain-containing protein n=1 Tax=Panagrolaimus sp. JU765 TaxID=591449 RepID=A0AC34QBH4_9BILA